MHSAAAIAFGGFALGGHRRAARRDCLRRQRTLGRLRQSGRTERPPQTRHELHGGACALPCRAKTRAQHRAETAALERLAAWAYQFSSTVILGEVPPDFRQARGGALWLEIGASLKLFGGFRNFIAALERELGHLHYSYQLGIGPTLEGAALLARGEIRVVIPSLAALQLRIRNMPIALLGLAPEIAGAVAYGGRAHDRFAAGAAARCGDQAFRSCSSAIFSTA